MIGLTVMLLGGFEARLASGATLNLPTKKAQALLAYLAVRPGQSHPRDKLAALLWGEKSDDQARGGLRHALVALRRALADANPPSLRIEGQTVALNPVGVEVDVVTFERRVAEGTPQALEQAAELYRGDLLLGFTVNEPLFEEWLVAERERLREMALEALARLLAHQSKAAGTERAIQTAVRLLGARSPAGGACTARSCGSTPARGGGEPRSSNTRCAWACCGGSWGRSPRRRRGSSIRSCFGARPRRRRLPTLERAIALAPRARSGRLHPISPRRRRRCSGGRRNSGGCEQLLDEAIQGHGHVATVVGEAGIGKTRLVSTLAADALSQGCRVLIGRCHESDSILPFGPWVDACRGGEISADEEILGALHPTRRAELTRLLPEAGMAGLPPASDSALPLFESVAELIEQVAARQPLVLVLEDLHWADEMSLRLLAFVSRRIPAWTALLIVTAREEELADASMVRRTVEDLSRAPHGTPVVLSPLSRPDTALLVRALTRVGSDASTVAHVEERVWAMSEGNPFVAVEAMRALDQEILSDGARDEGADGCPCPRACAISWPGGSTGSARAVSSWPPWPRSSGAGSTSRSSIPPAEWRSATRRRRSRRWSATACSRPWGTSWTSRTIGSAMSRMAGCSRPADGSSIAPSPRRSRRRARGPATRRACLPGIGSASKSSSSPITRSAASCGRRPCTISGRPAPRRRRGRRFRTLGRGLTRPSTPSSCCRRVRPIWSRPSRSASSCDRC